MPRFSFQVRIGGTTLGHGAAIEFDSFDQALDVAMRTMIGQALREADATLRLADSVLEIVDEGGAVVASLPIGSVVTRH